MVIANNPNPLGAFFSQNGAGGGPAPGDFSCAWGQGDKPVLFSPIFKGNFICWN
jgi:hypothetical protein